MDFRNWWRRTKRKKKNIVAVLSKDKVANSTAIVTPPSSSSDIGSIHPDTSLSSYFSSPNSNLNSSESLDHGDDTSMQCDATELTSGYHEDSSESPYQQSHSVSVEHMGLGNEQNVGDDSQELSPSGYFSSRDQCNNISGFSSTPKKSEKDDTKKNLSTVKAGNVQKKKLRRSNGIDWDLSFSDCETGAENIPPTSVKKRLLEFETVTSNFGTSKAITYPTLHKQHEKQVCVKKVSFKDQVAEPDVLAKKSVTSEPRENVFKKTVITRPRAESEPTSRSCQGNETLVKKMTRQFERQRQTEMWSSPDLQRKIATDASEKERSRTDRIKQGMWTDGYIHGNSKQLKRCSSFHHDTMGRENIEFNREVVTSEKIDWILETCRDPGTPTVQNLKKQFESSIEESLDAKVRKALRSCSLEDSEENELKHNGFTESKLSQEYGIEGKEVTNGQKEVILLGQEEKEDGKKFTREFHKDRMIICSTPRILGVNTEKNEILSVKKTSKDDSHSFDVLQTPPDLKFDKDNIEVTKEPGLKRKLSNVALLAEKFSNLFTWRRSPPTPSEDEWQTQNERFGGVSNFSDLQSISLSPYRDTDLAEDYSDNKNQKVTISRRASDVALLVHKFSRLNMRKKSSNSSASEGDDVHDSSNSKAGVPLVPTNNLRGKVRKLHPDEMRFFTGNGIAEQTWDQCEEHPYYRKFKGNQTHVCSSVCKDDCNEKTDLYDRPNDATLTDKLLEANSTDSHSHTQTSARIEGPSSSCKTTKEPITSSNASNKNLRGKTRELYPDELRFFTGDGLTKTGFVNAYRMHPYYQTKDDAQVQDSDFINDCHETNNIKQLGRSDSDVSLMSDRYKKDFTDNNVNASESDEDTLLDYFSRTITADVSKQSRLPQKFKGKTRELYPDELRFFTGEVLPTQKTNVHPYYA